MIKFIYRLVKEILSFLCIQLPLQLLGAVILLPVCYFYKIGKLPRVLRWFDSADPFVGRDTSVIDRLNDYPETSPYFRYSAYWTRYNWLAWRNPLNYFGYKYLGYYFTGQEKYKITGNPDVGDSRGSSPGLKIIEVKVDGIVKAYEYYYIHKWSDTTCFRFRLGVKIGDWNNPKGTFAQGVFVISPYKSYSGV